MNTTARLVRLPSFAEENGLLAFGEVGRQLPFAPQRYFSITGVPTGAVRGKHAHRTCHEFVVVAQGGCRVSLSDGAANDDVTLDSPTVGLHIPPLVWIELSDFKLATVVLVLASDPYDAADYVRSLPEFLELVAAP